MRQFKGVVAAIGLLVLGFAGRIEAHEIKVLAGHLVTQPGHRDTIYLSWGHILPVDMPIAAEDIKDYRFRTPSGSVQYLATNGYSLQANEVDVEERGLYTAEVSRHPSVFTVVVDPGGAHRHVSAPKAEATAEGGTIDYSARSHQYAKALIISGEAGSEAAGPIGQEFEIVALDAPEAWKAGGDLRVQVLFQGEPAPRQDVVARYLGFKPDEAWCYAIATDQDGMASIRVDRPGTWLIRAQRLQPSAEEDRSQFDVETYTASLALEVLP